MGDSPMVIVWLSRGESGEYDSVTLSQRKAPYEVMPTLDPNPPFVAEIAYTETSVRVSHRLFFFFVVLNFFDGAPRSP